MSRADYSQILQAAYNRFLLPLGGKKVPTPYRRNEFGSFQKVKPEFQGKSSPEVLTETTVKLAKRQEFNLDKASVEQIRQFMEKNKLGIDCSGFAYRILNELTETVLEKPLTALGFEHVGRTNVAKLTDNEHSIKVDNFSQAKAGDLLRLNSGSDDGILHCLVFLRVDGKTITYAHSSGETRPKGVHQDKIARGKLPAELLVFSFDPSSGDGIRRLKALK